MNNTQTNKVFSSTAGFDKKEPAMPSTANTNDILRSSINNAAGEIRIGSRDTPQKVYVHQEQLLTNNTNQTFYKS